MNPSISRRDFVRGAVAGVGGSSLMGVPVGHASPVGAGITGDESPASLIVRNAKVTTMDAAKPDAQAFAVQGNRFASVGSNAEIDALRGPSTRVIDAKGARVIPGLNDNHTHTIRGGLNYALELRFDGVHSKAQAMQMLREQIDRTPPGQWVRVVGGFSPEQFADGGLPSLDEINALSSDTPIFMLHVYTKAFLNRAALRALGIDRDFPDDRYGGGTIVRDESGRPTGAMLATPSALILYSTLHDGPKLEREDQLVSSRHFMRELNRLGVTSTLDCGGGFQFYPDDYGVITELHRQKQMTMRIGFATFIQRPGHELEDFQNWTQRFTPGEGDDFFKLWGGGEMLVRSIYDFEVFNLPRVTPPSHAEADLEPVVRLLAEKRWPFRFHATYDETVARHLDVLERVHRDVPIDDLRWVVDHGETLKPNTIDRIAELGGCLAIQNRIAFQEDAFLDRYGPDAAADAPPIKRVLAAGIPVAAGTDMSRVSSYNPWLCLSWLVTGQGVGGRRLLGEQQRLDRHEALRLWTDNAYFSREEQIKGRIEPGLLADACVLSDDYFAVPEQDIRELTSDLTLVDGQVVHGQNDFASLAPTLPEPQPDWSPVNHFGGFQHAAT
ncbi:MAG: amidohydrolase [Planctomycetota bacterium]